MVRRRIGGGVCRLVRSSGGRYLFVPAAGAAGASAGAVVVPLAVHFPNLFIVRADEVLHQATGEVERAVWTARTLQKTVPRRISRVQGGAGKRRRVRTMSVIVACTVMPL